MSEMKYKIGITLSGGGARGIGHLGVLKALNEEGIYPDIISGTSMGAIMGAFYADGYTPDEIMDIFNKENIYSYFKYHLPKKGIIKTDKLFSALEGYLNADSFEDLKLPLYVSTTNFENGQECFFSSGNLIQSLQATTAAPILFDPVIIDNIHHVDGGLVNNLPVEPLLNRCRKLIGVSVNPIIELNAEDLNSMFGNMERVMVIGLWQNIKMNIPKCDLFIEPPTLGNYSVREVSKIQEIFEIAYNYTKSLLKEQKHKIMEVA